MLLRVLLGLVVLAPVVPAAAQERHVRTFLDWDAALDEAGCASSTDVATAAEVRLQRALGATTRDEAELILAARRIAGRTVSAELTLMLADGTVLGTRRLETRDPTCGDLGAGLPLVIALMVDLHEREAVLLLPPPVPPPAPPPPPPPPAPPPPPVIEEPRGPVFTLEIGSSLDVGGLPQPAISVEATATLRPHGSPVGVLVRGGIVTPQMSGEAIQLAVWGARGAAGACLEGDLPPLRLGGCALVEAGWLQATGGGLSTSRAADTFQLAAVLLGDLLWIVDAFQLRVEAGIGVPLVRTRFVYDVGGVEQPLFVASPVSFRAGLTVGVRAF